MVEQAGRADPATNAARAWVAGEMSSREYFAWARRTRYGRRRPWRDRLRAWRGGREGRRL